MGREDELSVVGGLLAKPEVRLLTVVGPAGVGKTRLALEVLRASTAGGGAAMFVPLADIRDPAGLSDGILAALGVAETGPRPAFDLVVESINDQPLLVVLDNFEHLMAAAPMLSELVDAVPGASFLVTSRQSLAIRCEHCVRLAPLSLPPLDSPSVSSTAGSTAVALFIDRVEAAGGAQFVLTEDSAVEVARICRRVDGLPLGIELAAARARSLSLRALADALDARLPVLDRGARDVPARQRTMAAAVTWSTDLLPDQSAAVFRRLSVCVGGATLDAAAALSADLGLSGGSLLDALDDLVSHSLLVLDADGRYRMLEVVRDIALDELERAGEADAAKQRHARHFLGFAEAARGHLTGADQAAVLDAFHLEAPNFSAAVRRAVDAEDAEVALRLCVSLRFLWYVRGPLAEGRTLFAAALATPGAPADLRAAALSEAAALARHHGDFGAAERLTAEAVQLSKASDDDRLRAVTLLQRGFVLHLVGRYDDARIALEQSLAISHLLDDKLGVARASHHLGLVAAWGQADLGLAWELQCRCLALFQELGNERHVATVLIAMSELARGRGDLSAAHRLGDEARGHVRRLRDLPLAVYALHHAAALAADEDQLSLAARLLGAAEGIEARTGAAPWPAVAAGASRWLPSVQQRLGQRRVEALRAEARQLAVDDALTLAASRTDNSGEPPLTRREHEVVALVGEGLTNRAIGGQLFVSERTVEGHVSRILAKLGLQSRAQIAAWIASRQP